MAFLTRLLLVVTLMAGHCIPKNLEGFSRLTMTSIAARQDKLLQKFDEVTSRLDSLNSTQEELVSKFSRDEHCNLTMTAHMNELENLKSLLEEFSRIQDLLAIDECESDTHNCSIYATCRDSPVNFNCSCLAGYSGDGLISEDIDECSGENMCNKHATCTNTIGNYTCQCSPGYEGDGYTCNDVDECGDDQNFCPENELCINYPGSYNCTGICREGFQIKGKICEDVNECSDPDICPEDQRCINLPGSYKCFVCTPPSIEMERLGCISYVRDYKTWSDAQANCNAVGASLLQGFNKQQFVNITEHFNKYHGFTWPWVGVKGGLFVKSNRTEQMNSRDKLLEGSRTEQMNSRDESLERLSPSGDDLPSSPQDDLWAAANGEPSATGAWDDCGLIYLSPYYPDLWDWRCSWRSPSLCQILD